MKLLIFTKERRNHYCIEFMFIGEKPKSMHDYHETKSVYIPVVSREFTEKAV
jgi:hypothetical protein